ncbi:MAG: putative monovalent cation/H+ antiporter subunit A [Anaerolineales bacterium]|nr:putative monovalent cation/H+ antiporter subunit A [Anaerolineales bacterium]MBX3035657.1 putative monovalent cation/H+ antiporter subunit A [Anaerolineales bacterium]
MIAVSVLSVFAVALLSPLLFRRQNNNISPWLIALLPLGLSAYYISLLPSAAVGNPLTFTRPWAEALGASFSFRADGLGLLFALLISGIGTLVVIYARGYLNQKDLALFYPWLLAFMGAMLGVALSDNLILLFIFWELTSLSSFMLIGFKNEKEAARSSALQALLVTSAGGLAMLAGIILLGMAGGTYEISALLSNRMAVQSHSLYLPALILILLGAFTKSAQFPFHFWLPNAMVAPTPVSAYLHSATMVKAGVYLMARLHPVLGGTDAWTYIVGGVGTLTMLIGGYLALSQTDLKRLLAYSTLSALGTLTMLIGLGTPLALKAAVVLLLAHGLYKGALFLVAGALEHETGTRDVTKLGGLFRVMPITAIGAGVAALSMAGLPPLFGFISKELIYETGLEINLWLTVAIVAMGLFNVFIAIVVGVGPFIGKQTKTPNKAHEVPFSMWLAPTLLAGLSLFAGMFPGEVSSLIISSATSSVVGEAVVVKLKLWHGINPAFLLSIGTVIAGIALFFVRNSLRSVLQKFEWKWGPGYLYNYALEGLMNFANWQTRIIQHGYLRYYLRVIVLILTVSGAVALWRIPSVNLISSFNDSNTSNVMFYDVMLAVLILGSALVAVLSPSRMGAIVALGAAGYLIALIYLFFGAPDLAITQFAIESLTVILFVLAFYHLPKFQTFSSASERKIDAVISLLAGALMTMLVLVAVDVQIASSISHYYIENSLPLAYGRNIVNVILVDFRNLDTLGEITVLGVAGIGVYALLKFRKGKE